MENEKVIHHYEWCDEKPEPMKEVVEKNTESWIMRTWEKIAVWPQEKQNENKLHSLRYGEHVNKDNVSPSYGQMRLTILYGIDSITPYRIIPAYKRHPTSSVTYF